MTEALVWVGVGFLGGLASIARFVIDASVSERVGGRLPIGTFVVNLSGAALLGLVTGLALGGHALLLAGTAALGSYTTFSTWMFESHRLAQDDQRAVLAANVLASLVLGVAAAELGRWIGGW
jgi:fluoride exporter